MFPLVLKAGGDGQRDREPGANLLERKGNDSEPVGNSRIEGDTI